MFPTGPLPHSIFTALKDDLLHGGAEIIGDTSSLVAAGTSRI